MLLSYHFARDTSFSAQGVSDLALMRVCRIRKDVSRVEAALTRFLISEPLLSLSSASQSRPCRRPCPSHSCRRGTFEALRDLRVPMHLSAYVHKMQPTCSDAYEECGGCDTHADCQCCRHALVVCSGALSTLLASSTPGTKSQHPLYDESLGKGCGDMVGKPNFCLRTSGVSGTSPSARSLISGAYGT